MKLKLLGPPGTGKTTRLMEYLEKEVEMGTRPDKLAFLTFTRAARVEALSRVKVTEKEMPYLKTIHSIAYHQLAIGNDQIVRPNNLRDFGKKLGLYITGVTHDPWIEEYGNTTEPPTRDDILIQANHNGRHRKIQLKEAMSQLNIDIDFMYATWFTRAYREWKNANALLDYTDLLSRYIEYGRPLDIDAIFIDEAQDLSLLQWDVVERLGAKAQRWYIAGDDDQAIFHWAGADASVFQDLEVDKVEILDQSYRLSHSVHSLANSISSRIRRRIRKDFRPTQSEGSVENAGLIGSLDFSKKTFILFRNHFRGQIIAEALRNELIPFIGRGTPLMDADPKIAIFVWHELLKKGESSSEGVKKLLRYADSEFINPAVHSLVNTKQRLMLEDVFLGKFTLDRWERILKRLPKKDIFREYINKNGFVKTASPRIEVLSIHQSKGREAHTVVIDPEMSRATFNGMASNPDDEHRVWYVGVTRAKERVYFLLPDGPYAYKF